ncbi:MAG: ferrous iron transport protein B [Campylobacter sp.]|nr:ferrous iron transport protein B [Campylobacter sp.]
MNLTIALAGQPNCGKSTIFSMLSGVKQHIANYPGVTVDKKSGYFSYKELDVELVDLPGTYSFNSYSLEERVVKEYMLNEKVDLILNIVDASNLKRNLYLTFQLLEIGKPVIVILNMWDIAQRRDIFIDIEKLSLLLGCPIVTTVGAKKEGKKEILDAIYNVYKKIDKYNEFKINYDELEPYIENVKNSLSNNVVNSINASKRWVALKALENDSVIIKTINNENFTNTVKENVEDFNQQYSKKTENFLASYRYQSAEYLFSEVVEERKKDKVTLTEKIDKIILNRWLSFPILLLVIIAIYQLAIVQGYKLSDQIWPFWGNLKVFIANLCPDADIINIPMISDLVNWLTNSAVALLNYLPIFFILFMLIAIMEDVGYMPRMAFILDRVFRKFGLHGQSTLPLVLGGAFVGGCAVPGIMSTKGIADDRARMATILTVPLMNCLAKVPFYTLILGAFFPNQMGIMMFYISTITIISALIIAKFLTSTILKVRQTAPFVMELPAYHVPTFKGVILKAFERVWLYIKKVFTIVMAVAIILFALLQLPGISAEKVQYYNANEAKILKIFDEVASNTNYYTLLDSREKVSLLVNIYEKHKEQKMLGKKGADDKFEAKYPEYFVFLKPKKDEEAKDINKALRKLVSEKNTILRDQKNERIENSMLGIIGRALENVTYLAGFDWKVNIAFLSSFAARESAVATLGSIYELGKAPEVDLLNKNKEDELTQGEIEQNLDTLRAEEMMRNNSGYTSLHATSILIFMLLTPPCIAAMIMVKMQTNSWKWMCFATVGPFALGLIVASIVFSAGQALGASGLGAMSVYYFTLLAVVVLIALTPTKNRNFSGGFNKNKS